jgi:hypothetical protein
MRRVQQVGVKVAHAVQVECFPVANGVLRGVGVVRCRHASGRRTAFARFPLRPRPGLPGLPQVDESAAQAGRTQHMGAIA